MCADDLKKHGEIRLFLHHIYEYKKGVRNLFLCTTSQACAQLVVERLKQQQIAYMIQQVVGHKVNLFFGHPSCVEAVRRFVTKPLNLLSPEEDFMLGIMLGYDIPKQCARYCNHS